MNETTAYDEQIAGLHAQADEARAQGDLQTARQISEAILQLVPGDAAALQRLQQLGAESSEPGAQSSGFELDEHAPPAAPPAQAPQEPAPDLDLDLDLDVDLGAQNPARAAAPPPPPAPDGQDGSTTVADLFMAAEELDEDAERYNESLAEGSAEGAAQAPEDQDSDDGANTQEREAALLVARAQRALKDGKLDEASTLAAQAMMIRDDAPGAQDLLDEIRTRRSRDGGEADRLLGEACEDLDAGRPDQALGRLEAALALAPEHPEILEQLDRARAMQGADPPASAPSSIGTGASSSFEASTEDEDWNSMPAIPLARRPAMRPTVGNNESAQMPTAGPPPPPPPPPAAPLGVEAPEAPEAPPETPEPPPPAASPPPPPGPELSGSVPAPVSRPASDVPAAPAKRAPQRRRKASAVEGRNARLAVLLVVVALGVGGWYGWSWWSGRTDSDGSSTGTVPETEAGTGAPETQAQPGTGQAVGAQAAGDPAPVDRQPRPSDVPALLDRADRLTAAERYEEALSVLEAARQADPTSFEIVDRLERVRALARERQEAMERIAMGRDLFRSGSYREALRLFYRIPQKYRPARLQSWIAHGWYNLGIQSLQAGNLVEARRFFQDSLELKPSDAAVQRHQELIRRYRGRGLDEIYWAYVNRLQPRALPE